MLQGFNIFSADLRTRPATQPLLASFAALSGRRVPSQTDLVMPMLHRAVYTLGSMLIAAAAAVAQTPASSPDFFETKVRPVLANSCHSCHAASQLGGLRLDSRDAMLKGGKHGAAIVPGDPENSLLVKAIRQQGELKMPMGAKLKPAEIDDLVAWIKAGAVWPQAPASAASSATGSYTIAPERRQFWSLQP